MTGSTTPGKDRVYSFGPFIADPAGGTVSREGVLLSISVKSFQVLITLIERRDRLVRKDELIQLVWPDTFVVENNLARHVSIIRKALGADHGSDYILTVPGRGYRFVAAVHEISRADLASHTATARTSCNDLEAADCEPVVPVSSAPVQDQPGARAAALSGSGSRFRTGAIGVLVAAAITGTILVVATMFRSTGAELFGRKLWQLTTGGGLDMDPTWAPDGQRIAYASDRDGNFDIWVQPVHDSSHQKLTSSSAHDWQPAWSPDGSTIAFRSERDGGGLFVMAAAGGSERRLTNFGFKPRWSSRGGTLLFNHGPTSGKLYTVAADGTGLQQILVTFLTHFGEYYAAWHPDGTRISIYGNHKQQGWSFWTVQPDGSLPLRSEASEEVRARLDSADVDFGEFSWSPAGDAIYFEGRSADALNVWSVKIDPHTLAWQGGPDRLTIGGGADRSMVPSFDGKQIALSSQVETTSLWSFPIDTANGQMLGEGQPLFALSAEALYPDMSRDGNSIVYRVSRRGEYQLWRQSLTGGSARHILTAQELYTPRLSPDGNTVAYRRVVGKKNLIALMSGDTGVERSLTSAVDAFLTPSDWSSDGTSIVGTCEQNVPGSRSLCLLRVADAPRAEVHLRIIASDFDRSLFQAKFSPDDRWIAFLAINRQTSQTLYVMDLTTGKWIPFTDGLFRDDKPRWSPDGRALYYVSDRSGFPNVWRKSFDPATGQPARVVTQVTSFTTPRTHISWPMATMELAVAPNRLILPIVESSGSIWILEGSDR